MKKLKASEVLCKTRIKQTENVLACPDGQMCAEGVLLKKMGYTLADLVNQSSCLPLSVLDSSRMSEVERFYKKIEQVYGMDRVTWKEIAMKNDEGWSFKEIAEWLKGKGL